MNKQDKKRWVVIVDIFDYYIRMREGDIRTYKTVTGDIVELPLGVISLDKVLEIIRRRADLKNVIDGKNAKEEIEWQLMKRGIRILSSAKAYRLYNTMTCIILERVERTNVSQVNKNKRY